MFAASDEGHLLWMAGLERNCGTIKPVPKLHPHLFHTKSMACLVKLTGESFLMEYAIAEIIDLGSREPRGQRGNGMQDWIWST